MFRIFAGFPGFEDGFRPPLVFALYVFQLFVRQVLQPHKRIVRFADANEFVQLTWIAAESRFCEFWFRNTIRNVTMVVPVLITSCQVSENPKKGPEIAQTTTVPRARANTQALPTSREPTFATSANSLLNVPGCFVGAAG